MNFKSYRILSFLILIVISLYSCKKDESADCTPMEPIELDDCVTYEPTVAENTFTSTWTVANERDTFFNEIQIPAGDFGGGYVSVAVESFDDDLIPWLTVQPDITLPAGAIFSGSAATTNNEQIEQGFFSVHPGIEYGIEVLPFFNAAEYPQTYEVRWEFFSRPDCFEPNDTQAEAKKVLLNNINEAYMIAGHINPGVGALDDNTYDWYKVELTSAAVLKSELLQSPTDMTISMSVFDDQGSAFVMNHVVTQAGGDFDNGSLSYVESNSELPAGTYFISIHGDFLADGRKSDMDDPLPDHFNTTYRFQVTTP